jgi:hypothetical protein
LALPDVDQHSQRTGHPADVVVLSLIVLPRTYASISATGGTHDVARFVQRVQALTGGETADREALTPDRADAMVVLRREKGRRCSAQALLNVAAA